MPFSYIRSHQPFDDTTAGSSSLNSTCEAATELNYDNNDVWQSILNTKAQQFEDMEDRSSGSSLNLLSKTSLDWLRRLLNPRFISLKDIAGFNKDVLSTLERSVEKYDSDAKIKMLHIAFDNRELAASAETKVKVKADEASWDGDVYRQYFLLQGEILNGKPTESRAIHRFIQLEINYRDHLVAPPPYDEATSDKRASRLPVDMKTWSTSHTGIGQKKGEGEESFLKPDHVYACRLSKEDRENYEELRISKFPAFRASAAFATFHRLTPAYLIEESKPDESQAQEAENYLLMVAAILLHERLLLRSIARGDYEKKEFQLDDSHRVFFMTCCGRKVCLYQMQVKDIWTTGHEEQDIGEPIGYEAAVLDEMDLFIESHGEHLKSWLKAIHGWGVTVHYGRVLGEAKRAEIVETKRLEKVAFRYAKDRHTMTFEDPQANEASHRRSTLCPAEVPAASVGMDSAHWQPRLKSDEHRDEEMKEDRGKTEEQPKANSVKEAPDKTELRCNAPKQQKNSPVKGVRKSSRVAADAKRTASEELEEGKASRKRAKKSTPI